MADALIMSSLFGELWRLGVVVVATSNRAPTELYLDGLNRPYFLPFIALLQRQCVVADMDSAVDHRTKFRSALGDSYFTPLDACVRALCALCACVGRGTGSRGLLLTPTQPHLPTHSTEPAPPSSRQRTSP